ncbi:MAG: hypothetical protein KIPDCIKN_02309 [Haliscomenobacter sp.]|nr:hypothetical protein [Haliscomenobacter sp.]
MIYLNPNRYENACDNHYQKIHKIILNEIESHKKTRLQYCLKNYIKENLKDIITGFPNVLLEKNNEFLELIQKRKNRKIAEQEAEVRKIISYKNFQHKNKTKYDAFDLAENLNANTCSYCNRQYTVTVLDKKSEEGHIARPQFDHFFPQSKYPLLALSFYNLIPSCSICNGTLKRDQEFNLDDYIHPYLHDCNQHFRFSFSPLNIQSLKGVYTSPKLQPR